jgi:hypothetical protein
MTRFWFAIPFVVLGVAAVGYGVVQSDAPTGSALLIELGVETIGLALTVAVVDWFFERRRLAAEGRRHAWQIFQAIERIVWVWQGGPPRLEADEMLSLLGDADPEGEIASETESLLLALAVQSRKLLKADADAVTAFSGLEGCLGDLTMFTNVAHGGRTPSTAAMISNLADVTRRLAKLLELSDDAIVPARLIRGRDPSVAAQVERARVTQDVLTVT